MNTVTDYVILPKQDWQDILDTIRQKTGKDGLLTSKEVVMELNLLEKREGIEIQNENIEKNED